MGTAYVNGIQGSDRYWLKGAACAKHYVVHSGPESQRYVTIRLVTYLLVFLVLVFLHQPNTSFSNGTFDYFFQTTGHKAISVGNTISHYSL
jgi:hypothetical protein